MSRDQEKRLMMKHRNKQSEQRGATLLEVLVAIVVLSFGLLGMAGLQIAALQSNRSALESSRATMLAYDLLDRMRANLREVRKGEYDTSGSSPVSKAPGKGNRATKEDMSQWVNSLKQTLGDAEEEAGSGGDDEEETPASKVRFMICPASVEGECASSRNKDHYTLVHIEWPARSLAGDSATDVTRTVKVLGRM